MTTCFYGSIVFIVVVLFAIIRAGHPKVQSYDEFIDEEAKREKMQSDYEAGINP